MSISGGVRASIGGVGNRVTFIDKNLEHRIGLIVRVNQHTATLDCNGHKWRVAFKLLRHLVDV